MNRISIMAACVLTLPFTGSAQTPSQDISDDQRRQMIEQLESIQDSSANRKKRLIQAGIAALTPASQSDSEAAGLFEKCYKKVQFDDKGKKDKDWRDWKSKNKDQLTSAVNKKALRYQIQWALLTLKAGLEPDETYDPQKYVAQAVSLMTEIFKDTKLVADSTSPYNSPVVTGAIGKMYELESCKRKNWPDDIMDPLQVIETLVLKPSREKKDYVELRKGWNTLIALEKAKQEIIDKSKQSIMGASASFYSISGDSDGNFTVIPRDSAENLAWSREVDCYQCGEKLTAANNMMAIIKGTKNARRQDNYVKTLTALLESEDPDNKSKVRMLPGYGVVVEKK